MHPIVERLLEERHIEDREAFLSPTYDTRHDPFLLNDMSEAVERILFAIEKGEKIAVWTDYDCDGIPAGAMLADFFRMIEYPVRSYIPERSEGYGLNETGALKLKEEGISLIVTADVGITNVSEVSFAKENGIDTIVTDHHLPGNELPPAIAVLNPHREDSTYPFSELCGTGVAFKLIEGILTRNRFGLAPGQEKWLLDLVALATVADMVSLTGENRTLVHFGLKVIQKGRRKGLAALLQAMRVPLNSITEDDIAFSIAPKINAASRMASPSLALELLTTEDDGRAKELAKQLVKLNDSRKLEGARVAKEVKHRLDGVPLSDVVVLGHSTWNPALLGIAATNVVETYQRTVCLWGMEGDLIKGSCRSDGTVNVVSLMAGAAQLFEDYGGHEKSGGFSLKKDAIHTLPQVLQETYEKVRMEGSDTENTLPMGDARISLSEVSESIYRALRKLAPFGVGNKKPIFVFEQVRVEKVLWFGKHQEHVRISVSDGAGAVRDAIGFFANRAAYRNELELLSPNDAVTIHASVEQSVFAGRKELRLRLEHLAFAN